MAHFSAPKFGIEDILLPKDHYASEVQTDVLVSRVDLVDTYVRITLLYSPKHVSRQAETIQKFGPYMSEPLTTVDFGVPTQGVSLACKTSSDLDGDDAYRVILQSPYGHGLELTFTYPAAQAGAIDAAAKTLLSSLQWKDRSTICKNVSDKLVGSWKNDYDLPAEDCPPGKKTATEGRMNFDSDGSFSYTQRFIHTLTESGEEEVEMAGLGFGSYETYEYEDGQVHQVTTDDDLEQTGVRVIKLDENQFSGNGEVWTRIVE